MTDTMADCELEMTTLEGGDGEAHELRQQAIALQETEASEDDFRAAEEADTLARPSQFVLGTRTGAPDGDVQVRKQGRIETDDGRAHMARQTVRGRSQSEAGSLTLERLEQARQKRALSPLPRIVSVSSDTLAGPSQLVLGTTGAPDGDVQVRKQGRIETDDGRAHMARQTVRGRSQSEAGSLTLDRLMQDRQKRALPPLPRIVSVSSNPEAADGQHPEADAHGEAEGPTDSTENNAEDEKTSTTSTCIAQPQVNIGPSRRPHISLCQAVQDGKYDIVERWLEYNEQPSRSHCSDKHGLFPIHYAAKFNQLEIMELLCSKLSGIADICVTKTTEGYTPLHLVARYNPYNSYESAEDEVDSDHTHTHTPAYKSQTSCKLAMKFLIAKNVDVNVEDRYGITPLHLACQVGNVEGVKVLLTAKHIRLDVKDGNGDTPLHEACFHGKEMITEMLLKEMKKTNRPELTVKNDLGLTPFHLACSKGHVKIANHLLKYSTETQPKLIQAVDNEGETPLHLACQNDNSEIVSILLEHKADIFARTSHGVTPVHVAAQYGCQAVLHTFFNHSRPKKLVNETDNFSQTPLHFAAENGKHEMMELLLKKGAKKDARDIDHYTPLLTAAEFGRIHCFRVLLRHDAAIDVQNKDRRNAVFLAAESNHQEIIDEIIIRPDREGKKLLSTPDVLLNTPLHVAAEKGNLETLRQLLQSGEINSCAKNVLGKTAMHLAAEKGHLHIITELEGFCPESVKSMDENGDTPLHLACSYGFVEAAEHLIKGGADIEARNAVRRTPIGCAAFHGHARVIEVLVSFKANLNPKDKLKNTPLQLAAKEGHVTAVEALLNHHASMTSLDQRKFNALDWAIENGHSDVAEAIVESFKWKSALTNYTRTQSGEITSPFRKLIQRMPDVAELVLNKCTSTNADKNIRPDSEKFAVTFNYEFLEDRERAALWIEEIDQDAEKPPKEEEQREQKWFNRTWCFSHSRNPKHPMRVMVESKRTQLLKHPLVYKLIEDKWSRYGRFLFYTALMFHIAFVILLMAFSLTLLNPFSPTCIAVSSGQFDLTQPGDQVSVNISQLQPPHDNITANYLNDANITVTGDIATINGYDLCFSAATEVRDAVSSILPVEPICGQCELSSSQMMFLVAAAVLIILYSLVQLILEAVYFYQQLYLYIFDISTWVNVPLYIFAIAFVSVFGKECLCPLEGQWQVGIAAVFLVWAHLILYMRRVRTLDTGIYVLMFKNIFIRFLKLTVLTVLLMFMFALTFYMAFRQFHSLFVNSPFTNPGHSLLKTIAMSIGDLGYDELFRQPTGGSSDSVPEIPFPEISYVLWIVFIILIPILFSNLLVGLAVDDIKGILEAAALTRLALRVELVLSLEDRFHFLLRCCKYCHSKVHIKDLTVYPNQELVNSALVSPVVRFLRGENYTSSEYISHVLNPTKTPVEQQTQTLMREISKIQETLKDIPKLQEALSKLLSQQAKSGPKSDGPRVVPDTPTV